MLSRLGYGSLTNPASAVWRVRSYSLTMDSAIPSSLCGKLVVLQSKAIFDISTTVFVAVQNMGGNFFHPIGRVSSIATNSLSSPSEGKTSSGLGASVGRKPMR